MKTVIKKSVIQTTAIGLILAGSLMFSPLASAAEKAGPQVQIPATSDAIWQSIDKEIEQLNKVIQTGTLEEVHHHAFAIRDLAAALPARSSSLPADKLNQVKANNKFVATLAERLDATGDAKDKAGTESNFQKLKGVLKTMRANYLGA
ncbi:MAG TPA: transporter [Oxalobacteraceae bacterium]|nr:transporter [Oxalobacteraceae bacterium]